MPEASDKTSVVETLKDTISKYKNRDLGGPIYDRQLGKVINERLPFGTFLENEVLFNRPLDAIDKTHIARTFMLEKAQHAGSSTEDPSSAKYIPSFIDFYEIDMSQFIGEKPSDYKTFADFFHRQIKPERRPIASPNDDNVIISAADCRCMVFDHINESKKFLIKGKHFELPILLGSNSRDNEHQKHSNELFEKYKDGPCINFRLAPQDYHHFHSPISGEVVRKYRIDGTSYPTLSMTLKSEVDVLTVNEREIIEVVNRQTGLSMIYIPIGASEVGKVVTEVKVGQKLKKGDEIGYFTYGGSDIWVSFNNPVKIQWDEDLVQYRLKGIETFLQCNMQLGKRIK